MNKLPKFHGTREELSAILSDGKVVVACYEKDEGHYQFRSSSGTLLNWWTSKGTMNVQGKAIASRPFREAVEQAAALLACSSDGQDNGPHVKVWTVA